jgi:hypothetical protein
MYLIIMLDVLYLRRISPTKEPVIIEFFLNIKSSIQYIILIKTISINFKIFIKKRKINIIP